AAAPQCVQGGADEASDRARPGRRGGRSAMTDFALGRPVNRVDGRAKVTGAARYAAEFDVPGLTHAALVLSTVPGGRIARIDTSAAEHAAGVRAVITHVNAPRLAYRPLPERPPVDPRAGDQLRVLQGPEIL